MRSYTSPKPSQNLTVHASQRMQQRCIPPAIIDLLLDFGASAPAVGGVDRYTFTKRSWRRAAGYLGSQAKHFERYRDAYLIVSPEGDIVTAAYRH